MLAEVIRKMYYCYLYNQKWWSILKVYWSALKNAIKQARPFFT